MASIGLKYLAWAKMATEPVDAVPTFAPGKVIGKAVSTSLTVTRAEGELSADDMVAEYASEFPPPPLRRRRTTFSWPIRRKCTAQSM